MVSKKNNAKRSTDLARNVRDHVEADQESRIATEEALDRLNAAANVRATWRRLIVGFTPGDVNELLAAILDRCTPRVRAALRREYPRGDPKGAARMKRRDAERANWLRVVTRGLPLEGFYPGKEGPRRIAEMLQSTHQAIADGDYLGVVAPTKHVMPGDFVARVEQRVRDVVRTGEGGWVEADDRRPAPRRGRPGRSASWPAWLDSAFLAVARYAARLASGLSAADLDAIERPARSEAARRAREAQQRFVKMLQTARIWDASENAK